MKRKSSPWWREEFGMATKAELEGKIRGRINSATIGEPLPADAQAWFERILSHHYQYAAKVGCGIRHLEVRINPAWSGPTRGLWIIRADGTEIDISWVVALSPGGRPDAKSCVSQAARCEIAPEIHAFHEHGPVGDCPICGATMARGIGLHVDHLVPFTMVLRDFLDFEGLDYSDVELEDKGLEAWFKNRDLATRWREYHTLFADLRLVHASCNLSRGRAA